MNVRALLKETIYGLAHISGLVGASRWRRRDGLTVLTYHSFGSTEDHPYLHRLPVPYLEAQFAHLRRYYEVVDLKEGLARLVRGTPAARCRPMVAITVDDGYSDNYEHLLPCLEAFGFPATIFLATDYLDSGTLPWPTRISALLHHATARAIASPIPLGLTTPTERYAAGRTLRQHFSRLGHEEREAQFALLVRELEPLPFAPLPPLTWANVREMCGKGVRFGAHTQFHGWLDRLGPEEVGRELTQARQRIEFETSSTCRILAYPNGNWNDAVAEAARGAGFEYALTQDAGINRVEQLRPLALARIEIPYNERLGSFVCRVGGMAI